MNNICPKCKKIYIGKRKFGEPDYLGIVACIWHKEERKLTILGEMQIIRTEKCFLTQEEWDKTE